MKLISPEHEFSDPSELEEFLRKVDREERLVSPQKLKLLENDFLRFNGDELQLTRKGRGSPYHRLKIPALFADQVCDAEIRASIVNSLLRKERQPLKIEIIDDKVEAVIPEDWIPIPNGHILHEIKHFDGEVKDAAFHGGMLRITLTGREEVEASKGDPFLCGYEVVNDETGARRLEVSGFIYRIICANGLISKNSVAAFSWHCSSREPLGEVMEKVGSILASPLREERSIRLLRDAHRTSLGHLHAPLRDFLRKSFELEVFKEGFSDITEETTFYDLINRITSISRSYGLETRRRYEVLAGELLWALGKEGRARKGLLKQLMCRACTVDWASARAHPVSSGVAPLSGSPLLTSKAQRAIRDFWGGYRDCAVR